MKRNIGKILVFILLAGLLAGLSTTALAANSKLYKKFTGTLTGNQEKKLVFYVDKPTKVTIKIFNSSVPAEDVSNYKYELDVDHYELYTGGDYPVEWDTDVYTDSYWVEVGESAIISAKLDAGKYYYIIKPEYTNKYTKKYTVTVTATYASTISPKTKVLAQGKSFKPTVEYADDLTKTWSSSNKKVATVSSTGVVKAVGPGTATITCKLSNGKTLKTTVTVLQLSRTSLTLAKGNTFYLSVKGKGNRKVTWSSNDKTIAFITASGTVKGMKSGRAVISAKVGGITLKTNVHIISKPQLNKTSATMEVGKTLKLNLIGAGSQEVAWKTSSSKIASVSKDGLVTAKGKGTVKITAIQKDVKYACTIKVQ